MTGESQRSDITLLDGGMGRELMRMGAPFRQPEWSALALIEAPGYISKAHEAFAAAGSDIITTSNYGVVPPHIGEKRFWSEGAELTARSGRLAREVASRYGCRVAGSIPPPFGSYRPDLFIPEQAPALLALIVDALSPSIDIWLAETTSAVAEAEAVAAALAGDDRPLWVSFTLMDGEKSPELPPRLRSGETVTEAVRSAAEFGAAAILFNCSRPEVMSPAVRAAIEELDSGSPDIAVGVYANAFPAQEQDAEANLTLHHIRDDVDPAGYLDYAVQWCRLGASIIGGCCGIGPEHIAALRRHYEKT